MADFCIERGLCIGNKYFKLKYIHKYARAAKERDGMEVKSVIDLLSVNRYTLNMGLM